MTEPVQIYSTAAQMKAAIRTLYPAPEWALAFEVRDAAAMNARRSADALAMNTWPSRGLHIHGIEVKVSRSDWRSELKNPQKAEAVARYCDFWWIAAPTNVVPVAEIPSGWGLIEFDGKRWKHTKPAPKKEAEPITRQFLAPFLRRATEIDDEEVNALVNKRDEERRKRFDEQVTREVESRARRATQTLKAVEEFERASGLKIDPWSSGNLGQAVKIAKALGVKDDYASSALKALGQLEEATHSIRQALTEAGVELARTKN